MSAPVVDCTTGPARVRFDDHSTAMLRTIKAARGFTTVTAAAQWAAEVAYMALQDAPEVEQGLRPPAPEDGREGSGEPPASLPSVISLAEAKRLHPSNTGVFSHPMAHVHHGIGACVFGEECGR